MGGEWRGSNSWSCEGKVVRKDCRKLVRAAQKNLDRYFRTDKKDGTPHRPGKMWVALDWTPKSRDTSRVDLYKEEQDILKPYLDNWGCLEPRSPQIGM